MDWDGYRSQPGIGPNVFLEIAEYVRKYHRISRELHSSTAHRRRDLEKRLGNVNGAISKAVNALLGDDLSRALRDRLSALAA
jgi:hypothetical protein